MLHREFYFKIFFIIFGTARIESRDLFMGYMGMLPREILKNGAIWCILKCILIKFQGKNNLKISMFIATTTKKLRVCQERGRGVVDTDACVLGNFLRNGAIWYILKCILIKFQGENNLKISMFMATTTRIQKKWCDLVHFKVYFNQIFM